MMKRDKNLVIAVCMAVCTLVVFNCLNGVAGSLEPDGPPAPTMVTLGQLSEQIQVLSSPVKTVVRGTITFERDIALVTANLAAPVDPNRSIVLLSDSVTTERRTPDYPEWVGRTGTALVDLSANEITVRTEQLPVAQQVSYQIIEYK